MKRMILLLAVMCTVASPIAAQPNGEQKRQPVEFEDMYNRRFLQRDPQVGTKIPNVQAFDEKGEPFEWNSTHGKYTVVVFGCLT